MKKIFGLFIVLFFACVLSTSALAVSPFYFYVGGGIGESYVEEDNVLPGEDFEGEDFAFKVFGGYRFHKNFSVELAYLDFGKPDDNILGIDVETELYAVVLSGVGILPLSDRFELFAKLGVAHWDGKAKAEVAGLTARDDENGNKLAYGVGASFAITDQFAIRAEYEGINEHDDLDRFEIFTVGGELRF